MKISIVTITHNRAHLIGETIQSILNQTHRDFEHIIIDDGSTDDTQKVVECFNDSRIHYFKYPKTEKRSVLRNHGFRRATGELVAVIDSDDLWVAEKLETMCTLFKENHGLAFAFHNFDYFPNTNIDTILDRYNADFFRNILSELLQDKIVPYATYTIRKALLDELDLLDENTTDGQHDLYLRVAAKHEVYYCYQKMSHIRKHEQNLSLQRYTSHYDNYLYSLQKLFNENAISASQLQQLQSNIHKKIAAIHSANNEYGNARMHYVKSFRSHFWSRSGFVSFARFLFLTVAKS